MKSGIDKRNARQMTQIGSKYNALDERAEHDFYTTDPEAVELLLKHEKFSANIWEPACGGGHISKVLEAHGYSVKSTDLYDHGFGKSGLDFLETTGKYSGDIVTNPPFEKAFEFVKHAVETVTRGHKVAVYLRLLFLEGKARRSFFEEHPPKYVYVSSRRFVCPRNGDFESNKNKKAIAFAWFVWEKGFKGEPTIRWYD